MTGESVYEAAAAKLREEHMRLLGFQIDIMPDDKIREIREETPDFKPKAQMNVIWEPMSYRKEGGKYGNIETDYYALSNGLDDEQVAHVREALYRGVPQDKRMTIPKSISRASQPWQRFMMKAQQAGMRIVIADDGNFTSPDIGQIFRVEAGFETFPTFQPNKAGRGGRWTDPDKGEPGRDFYMRYPVENVTATYVQPTDVPVRIVNSSSDDESREAPVTSTASASGGVTKEALAGAFAEAGIIGMPESDFAAAPQQMRVTGENGSRAPILFLPAVQAEASAGTLLEFAVNLGAVTVEDGVIRSAV